MRVADKSATLAKTSKHLTFTLDGEEYGLDILKVQEIIGIMPITRVPRTPAFVRGVINLRGKVIPVVDLRLKFGMGTAEDTDRTCIVVVQVAGKNGGTVMGTVVDEVSEVIDIAEDAIEETPEFGADIDTDFVLGIGKIGDRVVMVLDIDKVLSASELTAIKRVASSKTGDDEKKEGE
ncbi:MAG: purine-binding chemotaxis protein CheW [Actinobacteria bacterium]|nr:MAG: purine-binding chemotaxis protein CheW [Actinomycetota bacterium]